MMSLNGDSLTEIAVLGAHCDDIAIGAGGTLLTLADAYPGLRVRALILSGRGTEREGEERHALSAFCPGAQVDVTVYDVADGSAPAEWARIKEALRHFRRRCEPQLILAPNREDAHHDHRLLAELITTEFRDHLVLRYEIVKWEIDTARPTLFHPLAPKIAATKARLLHEHYPSQRYRHWFDERTFLGLARIRGVQCGREFAEAFLIDKVMIDFGRTAGGRG
ncbi:PIG-L deacetylase family protein [Nocardia wallacei]